MHYLITGGLGFIGSHLSEALVRQGHRLTVLDDLSTGRHTHLPPGARLTEADVADSAAVAQAMEGVEGCFHLAAIASVERARQTPLRAHAVNNAGTLNVLEAARRSNVPVVYASSSAVYGKASPPLKESDVARPLSGYGVDKLSSELHAGVIEVRSVGLRLFNVYGPRQDPGSPYSGVVSQFARCALQGAPAVIYGDGSQTRDFIYVQDVVDAFTSSMQSLLAGRVVKGVYNICTGQAVSVLVLAQMMGLRHIDYVPARTGDITHSCGDAALAVRELGFRATTSLRKGLDLTLASMQCA